MSFGWISKKTGCAVASVKKWAEDIRGSSATARCTKDDTALVSSYPVEETRSEEPPTKLTKELLALKDNPTPASNNPIPGRITMEFAGLPIDQVITEVNNLVSMLKSRGATSTNFSISLWQ